MRLLAEQVVHQREHPAPAAEAEVEELRERPHRAWEAGVAGEHQEHSHLA